MDFKILLNFLIAIALGTLIGIERQRGQRTGGFAGIRTFIMIAFLGALTAFLYQELGDFQILIIVFLSIVTLITASYVISAKKGHIGITAEISGYICFFLGFIVMFDAYRNYGLIFGVLITILLSFKGVIHKFIEHAKDFEWNDTLKFALISFVILPLLPEQITIPIFPEGSLSGLNVFYPREIWFFVVFVSGVSFVGYFLLKIIGTRRGANLIGALGGIASSTAVTQSMANHSKVNVTSKIVRYKPLVTAVLLATLVSFVRIFIICVSVNKNLWIFVLPIVSMMFAGLILFLIFSEKKEDFDTKLKLESPLKLKPALILGLLYALVTLLSKLSFAAKLGKSGIIIASVITGFFEIDPIILAVGKLSSDGAIAISDSLVAILLALASNQITKTAIALSGGSKHFGRSVAIILLTFVVIIIGWVLYFKIV